MCIIVKPNYTSQNETPEILEIIKRRNKVLYSVRYFTLVLQNTIRGVKQEEKKCGIGNRMIKNRIY